MVKRVEADKTISHSGVTGISGKTVPPADPSSSAFRQVLESTYKQHEIIFSAHARARLEERNIRLGLEDIQKINRAMGKAESKGARSPLLLYKDIALVANIPNRTIITAVDGAGEKEQIYTGIDSAVIFQ